MYQKNKAARIDQMRAAHNKENGLDGTNSQSKCSTHSEAITTVIRVGGRIVAGVRGDRLTKDIQGSRHFLRKPLAIALDVNSIDQATAAGATWAEITDIETGRCYTARLTTILARGVPFNRGFGAQIYLPLDDWGRDGDPAQLVLFAEAV